jgi:hypothetical protein
MSVNIRLTRASAAKLSDLARDLRLGGIRPGAANVSTIIEALIRGADLNELREALRDER